MFDVSKTISFFFFGSEFWSFRFRKAEKIVLRIIQTLGLNTCWVGLSYSKVPGTYELEDGEKITCYIAIGYGET